MEHSTRHIACTVQKKHEELINLTTSYLFFMMFLQCVDGKTPIHLARLTGSNCNLEEIDLKLTKTAHNTLLPDMIVENEIGGKNGNLPNS